MNPERWNRINELFHASQELPADQRDAFLAGECGGDQPMLAELRKLLASEEAAGDEQFLGNNPMNVRDQLPASKHDGLGDRRIGNYRIKRQLGSGGMGNVFLAVRDEDFQQRVALKLLKRGLDSDAIVKRFRREIRVLAALGQHPNIARLIDAGTTEAGLPYFVMEFVEGEEIDKYCDTHKLTIRERLELAKTVCDAVHFAHQHTVIHRDLKPSNILVSKDGRVKLIDFGIAKLTAPELGFDTAVTAPELRAMTPEYASPEQVRGEAITTASDVYSLGIVLYQLLTGRRPYGFGERSPKVFEEVICRHQPLKPSTVVASTTKVAPSSDAMKTVKTETPDVVGQRRKTVPRALRKTLRGDLDNIVLKSLRKEPRDRYASAGQLAVDIQRYLTGQPVIARRLSTGQRLLRLAGNYPIVSGLIVATLLGSTFGLAYLSRLSQELVRKTELESAAEKAHLLYTGHKYYTNVLADIRKTAPDAAGQLKPPATFTIELFEFLNESRTDLGTTARMRSRFPFTNREGRAPLDAFEESAPRFF